MTARLPDTRWTQRDSLAKLVGALGAEDIRWVGGCVRDTLLGYQANDIDAATRHLPATVIDRCKDAGIRIVPTGIDHGTVTAIFEDGNVEITTLRRDVATDGRRATIAFSTDWSDDAARRDFTINALYAHPKTLEISDYFGGLDDLAARRVRFIGDAQTRIREDHLRILRYFRFATRFGDSWDAEATGACSALAPTLKGLSRERVGWELQNLLALPDPSATIAKMRELGVLQEVLPESGRREVEQLARLIPAETAAGIAPDPMRRMAALLPAIVPVAETVSARLRLSRGQRDRLMCVARRCPKDGEQPRGLAYEVGQSCAIDRLLIIGSDPSAIIGWEAPSFPLKGGEIVARGVGKGPEVARILQRIENRWVEEQFPPRPRVDEMLDEELAAR
ncbi:CCA tRNA nucleotidyltransferase [Qipengyuania qiaonensis]|uniref:CCA tRNA nucleotidyltransferase n=1 Tax=Qipengyuania qiaonensis TaxID=2867240 RepID=A0ABS7J8W1_9SPHN|nr:CCA tRNA nucleotidyltransferase [Qipengyuania qiaonensis]MBX7483696.1 CCA tRNA nucleotidyltransferase [Qipengyuania qiaonensis]